MGILQVSILLYIYILGSVASSLDTADGVTFEALCSRKCQDSENQNSTQDFPLYKCSCSPSCATYGDCCFDSDYRRNSTWVASEFICLSIVGRGQYRAVAGCPADQLSDFCKAGIGHLPPVTSRDTNTTYANIFCASCNEDGDNVAMWNVELRCSTDHGYVSEHSTNEPTQILYYVGHLWKFSPGNSSKSLCMYHVHFDNYNLIDSLELRHCESERRISECSASWRDPDVINVCRSYEDPIYIGNRVYKNIHCAECNYLIPKFAKCMPFNMEIMMEMGLVDASVIQFCKQRGSDTCMKYLYDLQKGRPYSFSDLMNINEEECVPPEGRRCCIGEKYDFRSKRCRKTSRGL